MLLHCCGRLILSVLGTRTLGITVGKVHARERGQEVESLRRPPGHCHGLSRVGRGAPLLPQVSQSLPLFSYHLIFHRTNQSDFFNSLDHWFIMKGDNSEAHIGKTCTEQRIEKGHEASTFSMNKSFSPRVHHPKSSPKSILVGFLWRPHYVDTIDHIRDQQPK